MNKLDHWDSLILFIKTELKAETKRIKKSQRIEKVKK